MCFYTKMNVNIQTFELRFPLIKFTEKCMTGFVNYLNLAQKSQISKNGGQFNEEEWVYLGGILMFPALCG